MVLATGTLATTAMAQTNSRTPLRDQARIELATFDSGQTNSLLQQTDWNEYRRCDGDHDRDDRVCYVGPRHHYRSYDGAIG